MSLKKVLTGTIGCVALLAACGGDEGGDGEYGLVAEGKLTVCTDSPYPPMEFEDPSTDTGYSGFDIDLMDAVAKDLGLELAIATPGWDAITSGLAMESGMCDIAASSITITAEREEGIDFSDPYFEAEQSLLVAADSEATTAGEVTIVAAQSGTTGETYASENLTAELISFEGPAEMFLALEAGQVNGVLTDLVVNQEYVFSNPGMGDVIETYSTDEQYGLAVKEEGSEELLAAINASIGTFRTDGTYDGIYSGWFG